MKFTNNEKSYGRNRRLFRVVSWYWELLEARGFGQDRGGKYAGMAPSPRCSTPINEINDHKGHLTVYWNGEPSDDEKRLISLAWRHVGDEDSEEVSHVIEEVCSGI
jgi:hypothetical protein